jgi:hypothetical protein
MTDPDTGAKALADAHDRILRRVDVLDARLARIERLLVEILDQIARAAEVRRDNNT